MGRIGISEVKDILKNLHDVNEITIDDKLITFKFQGQTCKLVLDDEMVSTLIINGESVGNHNSGDTDFYYANSEKVRINNLDVLKSLILEHI